MVRHGMWCNKLKVNAVLLFCWAVHAIACAESETTVCKETGRLCPSGTKCVMAGKTCAPLACGNGIKEEGEACDDGDNFDRSGDAGPDAGRTCSADCRSEEYCGNDVTDVHIGEVCDPPEDGKCSEDCKSTLECGNDYVDEGEECDGANTPKGTVCQNCRIVTCGNECKEEGEECDYADKDDDEPCTVLCRRPICGDGIVSYSAGEACDPGKDATCRDDCTGTIGCGDGWKSSTEECDDGNSTPGDGCGPTCLRERCGNKYEDPGEECDGTTEFGGPCSEDCLSDLTCGNGIKDPHEACDHASPVGGTRCSDDCTQLDGCGNGIVEAGEQCDPGLDDLTEGFSRNTANCNSNCTSPRCGDGHINEAFGEECDPGALESSASCSPTCKLTFCGDGFANRVAGEECDVDADTEACNGPRAGANACKAPVCGDRYVNEAANETCEPERDTETDEPIDSPSCNGPDAKNAGVACQQPRCGDGYVNAAFGEVCDDGEEDTASCNGPNASGVGAGCKPPACGDGYINRAAGEECELNGTDAPNENGDTSQCNGVNAGEVACKVPVCGDGYTNLAYEECDASNPADPKVDACNPSHAGEAACSVGACGDGFVGQDEECDPREDDGVSEGEDSIRCNGPRSPESACKFRSCGDGYINTAQGQGVSREECDPPGADCTIFCTKSVCGDGIINDVGHEQCDKLQGQWPPFCLNPEKRSNLPLALQCRVTSCGDGYLDPLFETCGDETTDVEPLDASVALDAVAVDGATVVESAVVESAVDESVGGDASAPANGPAHPKLNCTADCLTAP